MFARLSETNFLRFKCEFLEDQLAKTEGRLKRTEDALAQERAAKDRIILRYADQISVKNGVYGKFTQDAKEEVPETKSEPDEKLMWLAQQQRQADLDAGYTNVQPLEHYIEELSRNPEEYII